MKHNLSGYIWNNTPGIIQLCILVFGAMFIAWFLMVVSVFIDDQEQHD